MAMNCGEPAPSAAPMPEGVAPLVAMRNVVLCAPVLMPIAVAPHRSHN
jgi:hypothetical protein